MDNLFCLQIMRLTWIFRFDAILLNLRNVYLGRVTSLPTTSRTWQRNFFTLLSLLSQRHAKIKKPWIQVRDLPAGWLPSPSCLGLLEVRQHCSFSCPNHTCQRPYDIHNLPTPLDELTWEIHYHKLGWSWIALAASWAPLRQFLTITNHWKGRL